MGGHGDALDSASASGIDSFSDSSQAGEEPDSDGSGRSVVSVSRFSQLQQGVFPTWLDLKRPVKEHTAHN